MEAPQADPGDGARRGLWMALALGAVLRLVGAALASFHLDDFHSLHHARNVVGGPFWSVLLEDNHPPLSFVVLGAARALVGEHSLLLRLPNVAYGLLTIALAWRVGRHLPGRATPTLAALLVALSALHIELSIDLRMYGLLALATTGLLDAVLGVLRHGRGVGWLALWTVVGLHTHYHFLHVLFVTWVALALVLALRSETRRRLVPLLTGFGIAGLLALPWYVKGFPEQLSHGLAPGGSDVSPRTLAEGIGHLLFYRVSLGGEPLRTVLLAASAVALLLAAYGTLVRERRPEGLPARALLPALAFLLPAWTALIAHVLPRAGFEWRYLSAAIAPFALLVARAGGPGRTERLRRVALAAVLVAAGVNAALVVRDPGGEDYAGAVRFLLAERRPGDAVVAADWQPLLFPHGVGWSYYAPRLSDDPLGPELEHTDDFALVAPERLAGLERVWCLLRSIPPDVAFLRRLRAELGPEETWRFGESIFVLRFARDGADGG